jgi:hypothetical protein
MAKGEIIEANPKHERTRPPVTAIIPTSGFVWA